MSRGCLLLASTDLLETVGLAAHGLGNVLILRQALQILGPDSRQDVHYCRDWRPWVSSEIVNDRVRARPTTVHGNNSQHLICHRSHRRDVLNLLLRDAWVLYYRGTDHFVGIANENAAGLAISLHGPLH